jgi:hypothetical protein
MINARELRKKYMNDFNVPVDMQECLESIEKQIIEQAKSGEDFLEVAVPAEYKANIKEELEDEEYTVCSSSLSNKVAPEHYQYITIMWDKDLVYFDCDKEHL